MKRVFKKMGFCILAFFFIAIISYAAINDAAIYDTIPAGKPVADITDSINTDYSRLAKRFGENKEIPAGYEKQILYALSYFLDL